jgi:hypothetical protein
LRRGPHQDSTDSKERQRRDMQNALRRAAMRNLKNS